MGLPMGKGEQLNVTTTCFFCSVYKMDNAQNGHLLAIDIITAHMTLHVSFLHGFLEGETRLAY